MSVAAVTSTSSRDYSLTSGAVNQMLSYHINQNITYQACRHAPAPLGLPVTQQLSVDRVFALYDDEERVLRFAVANQIGPAEGTVSFFCCSGAKLHVIFLNSFLSSLRMIHRGYWRLLCQALSYMLGVKMNKAGSCAWGGDRGRRNGASRTVSLPSSGTEHNTWG